VLLPALKTKQLPLIPARYTCDGANISPPIKWQGVPANTAEIDLFLVHTIPHVVTRGFRYDWAILGLKPTIHELKAGETPAGAVLGRNGQGKVGYSLCPPKGKTYSYGLLIYASPSLSPYKPGFNPATAIEPTFNKSLGEGLLIHFSYRRR
jgi:phosphatidylethanolamine-binding protein (PEBP) family uncharacterized protein